MITNTQMAKATGFGVSVVYICNDFQASQEYTCLNKTKSLMWILGSCKLPEEGNEEELSG